MALVVLTVVTAVVVPRRLDYAAHALAGAGIALACVGGILGAKPTVSTAPLVAVAVATVAAIGLELTESGAQVDPLDVVLSGLGACVGAVAVPVSRRRDLVLVGIGALAVGGAWLLRAWWSQGAP